MRFMFTRLSALFCFAFLAFNFAQAAPSYYRTYLIVDVGFGPESYQVSGSPDGSSPQFLDLVKNIDTSIPFTLLGGEVQTGEGGSTVVDLARLYWRVYLATDTPGAYNTVPLGTCCDETGTDCDFGGPCVDSGFPAEFRRLFRENSLSVNVLDAQYVGEFNFDFYFEIESTSTTELLSEGTSEAPYTHTYCRMFESFSDSNFSTNLTWSGDLANWSVIFNSDVAAGATASNTLRLNVPSGVGTQYLSTTYSQWGDEQQWSFWMGRRAQAASLSNQIAVWLYADQTNLEAANINGYRILYGDDTGGDNVFLQRVTNGVPTTIVGSTEVLNGITDYGISVRVERDQFGTWSLFTSTLPVANGQGTIASDCVNATVSHGTNTDNTYNLTGLVATGYVGIVAVHSSAANAHVGVEFDQFGIRVTPAPPVDGCTDQLACNYNPFANNDDGSCTFPGCTDPAACNYDLNADCEDGSCAFPGCTDALACNYDPAAGCDDGSCVIFTYLEQFTDGNFTANPVWTGDTGNWLVVADSDASAGSIGSQTLRLNAPALAQAEHLVTGFSNWQDEQEWSFWLGRRGQALTAANTVAIWLYADQVNLESATISGYRLLLGDDAGVDEWRLQRVNSGVATTIITASAGVTNAITDFGFNTRVTRTWDGQWEIFTDALPIATGTGATANNCAEATISRGTATDNSIALAGPMLFGIVATHSTGAAAIISTEWDDIAINTNAVVYGCTDPLATNYDPLAIADDGSCTYTLANLVITEIHYNPDDAGGFPDADYEFLEIYNNDGGSVDISGYTLSNAVNFTFPAATTIAAGDYVIVAINAATYASLGCQVFQWTGQLNNTGETIELRDSFSQLVDIVAYANTAPWPLAAAGTGPSLELVDVNSDNNIGSNWEAQTVNGTPCGPILVVPGCTDPSATNYNVNATVWNGTCTYGAPTVVINEVHYNPCSLQGPDADFEFLELYNADPVNTIDISGWQVVGTELVFPAATFIAPGEYIVVAKNPATYTGNGYQVFGFGSIGSGLLNTGEPISLIDASSNVIDYVLYGISAPWPSEANGECPTLELTDPLGDNFDPANWQLSSNSGGTPGAPNSSVFECTDCGEIGAVTETVLTDNFDDGSLTGWQLSNGSHWSASTSSPIGGTHSLKHEGAGVGSAYASAPLACAGLSGLCTVWQFEGLYNFTPSAGDRFVYFLASDNANLGAAGLNGYAVGLNYATINNRLALYQVSAGVYTEVMSVPFELPSGTAFSVQVIRDEFGDMMLNYDTNGGFDLLIQAQVGAVNLTGLSNGGNTGVYFEHTGAGAGNLRIDNISITQCATLKIYYSQMTGDFETAVWSTLPVGPVAAFTSNSFASIVVQNGHTVTQNQTEQVRHVTVNAGGTLALNNNQLVVNGDLTVNATGQYNGYPGHTMLVCDPSQQVVADGTVTFGELTLNNPAGASVSGGGQALLRGVFSPAAGTFNAGTGQFILDANGTYAGFIGSIQSGADVTGSVTVRTYVPAAPVWNGSSATTGNGYVTLTTPIQNQTIEEWDDDVLITGFPGSDFPTYYFQSMHYYDETVPGQRALGFTVPTSTANPLVPWLGYSTYVLQGAQTLDNTGDIFKGNQTIPLTRTLSLGGTHDGWNQVGNSYPAPIDFDAMFYYTDAIPLNGNDAPGFFYVFDQQINGYRVWNTLLQTGNGSRYIGRGQGIFVWAQNNFLNFQLHEGLKYTAPGAPVAIERNGENHPMVALAIGNGEMLDESFIVWHQLGEDAMQPGLDAPKFGGAIRISTLMEEEELSINALSTEFNALSIPVLIEVTEDWVTGPYTVSFPNVENLPEGVCLSVEDVLTGEIFPLELGLNFPIELDGLMSEVRYVIHLVKPASVEVMDATCFGSTTGTIEIETLPGTDWNVWVMDQNGQTVLNTATNGTSVILNGLAAGTYVMVLNGDLNACGTMTYNIEVGQPVEEIMVTSFDKATCNGNTGVISMLPENMGAYNMVLTNAAGAQIETVNDAMGNYDFVSLPAGEYTVTWTSACWTGSMDFNLFDENAITAAFSVNPDAIELENGLATVNFTNLSTNATNFSWTINGELVSTEVDFVYTFTEVGTYLVEMGAYSANCANVTQQTLEVSEIISVNEIGAIGISLVQMGGNLGITLGQAMDKALFDIFDNTGRLVYSEQMNLPAGATVVELPGILAAGIYTVRLTDGTISETLRIVR